MKILKISGTKAEKDYLIYLVLIQEILLITLLSEEKNVGEFYMIKLRKLKEIVTHLRILFHFNG